MPTSLINPTLPEKKLYTSNGAVSEQGNIFEVNYIHNIITYSTCSKLKRKNIAWSYVSIPNFKQIYDALAGWKQYIRSCLSRTKFNKFLAGIYLSTIETQKQCVKSVQSQE